MVDMRVPTFYVCALVLVTFLCLLTTEAGYRGKGYYRKGKYPPWPRRVIVRYSRVRYNRYKTGQWSVWGSWGSWSQCSSSGQKYRFRFRRCYNKTWRDWVVKAVCTGTSYRKQTRRCKVNFKWTSWGDWRGWGPCVGFCGERGVQKRTRYRYCKNDEGRRVVVLGNSKQWRVGNNLCVGNYSRTERKYCGDSYRYSSSTCRSVWAKWGTWGDCKTNCSVYGLRKRQRQMLCIYPTTLLKGKRDTPMETYDLHRRGSTSRYYYSRYRYSRYRYYNRKSRCNAKRVNTQSNICRGKLPKGQSWTSWSAWSGNVTCSRSCGGGIRVQTRHRFCNGTISGSGISSKKTQRKIYRCNTKSCRIPGTYNWASWGNWRKWSSCMGNCGERGVQKRTRYRTCKVKKNKYYYRYGRYRNSRYSLTVSSWRCVGNYSQTETQVCSDQAFKSSDTCWSRWGTWERWGDCRTNCSTMGVRKRQRPMLCLYKSTAKNAQRISVYVRRSYYSYRSRYRYYRIRSRCNTKRSRSQIRTCYGKIPSDQTLGSWSTWSSNETCSKSCGGGIKLLKRYRFCNGTGSTNSNFSTQITQRKFRRCNTKSCPFSGSFQWTTWGNWRGWGSCVGNCGERGVQKRTRYRKCKVRKDSPFYRYGRYSLTLSKRRCAGNYSQTETQRCPDKVFKFSDTCWSRWGSWEIWGDCSTNCSVKGVRKRQRPMLCLYQSTVANGQRSSVYVRRSHYSYRSRYHYYRIRSRCNTKRSRSQIRTCYGKVSSDHTLGTWSAWSSNETCSKSCGGGIKLLKRYRFCNGTGSMNSNFSTQITQRKYLRCNTKSCPISGNFQWTAWGDWRGWGPCVGVCGEKGVQKRTRFRYCKMDKSVYRNGRYRLTVNNLNCAGNYSQVETKNCKEQNIKSSMTCRSTWGSWENWGDCKTNCTVWGIRKRQRPLLCLYPSATDWLISKREMPARSEERNLRSMVYRRRYYYSGRYYRLRTRCNVKKVRLQRKVCFGKSSGSFLMAWSAWTNNGTCSKSCGGGIRIQTRHRYCNGTESECKNSGCSGTMLQRKFLRCNLNSCTNSSCTMVQRPGSLIGTTFENTYSIRYERSFLGCKRSCLTDTTCKAVHYQYSFCFKYSNTTRVERKSGSRFADKVCNKVKAVDGRWGNWSAWIPGKCSVSCENGTQINTRTRTCNGPSNGGKPCSGSSTQNVTVTCFKTLCPVDGIWRSWSDWVYDKCSVTCGNGTRTKVRSRTCEVPLHGGQNCTGSATETVTEDCEMTECPVDGNWREWTDWQYEDCSVTCGNGTTTKSRSRICEGPRHDGKDCIGPGVENVTVDCSMEPCPIDGTWQDWTQWEYGDCSVTCGNGTVWKSRSRVCDGPLNDGEDCVGSAVQNVTEVCEMEQCPVDGQWLGWTSWETAECSVTCGNGTVWKIRTRSCEGQAFGGKDCEGESIQNITETCSMDPCLAAKSCPWSEWSPWGACSVTCGSGVRFSNRTRDVKKDPACGDSTVQRRTEYCREKPCLITPPLSEKDSWTLMQLLQLYKRMMLINQPCHMNDTLRHPTNCSVYFECDQNQQFIPRECGVNEEYNEEMGICTKERQPECNFTMPGSATLDQSKDLYHVLNKEFMRKYHYTESDLPDKGLRMLQIIDLMFPDMYIAGVCEGNVTRIHPLDCSRYLKCNQGMLQEQRCGEGEEFDSVTQKCSSNDMVECGHVTDEHPCEEMFGLYPTESDCTQYHVCIYGRTHTYMCQKGYVFDPKIRFCRSRTDGDC